MQSVHHTENVAWSKAQLTTALRLVMEVSPKMIKMRGVKLTLLNIAEILKNFHAYAEINQAYTCLGVLLRIDQNSSSYRICHMDPYRSWYNESARVH